MTIETNKTYTIKLNSGEEIVCKVVGETDLGYTIEKPLSLGTLPNGKPGMGATLQTADYDRSMTLNKMSVAIMCITQEDASDQYLTITTGIEPVKNKILLG